MSNRFNADTLEQQIAAYRSKFEAFQSQLDERLKQFSDFESNVPKVEKQNIAREAEIDRLTEKADSMIKGATTAGLSNSIGFTMSIFITNLTFTGEAELINASKLAILLASLTAGSIGFLWLMLFGKPQVQKNTE